MSIISGATAVVALIGAGPAGAEPQMDGHYVRTATNRLNHQTFTTYWFATPCGVGCASVEACATDNHEGCSIAQAHLVNGEWTMSLPVTVVCSDQFGNPKGDIPGTAHYTWDPNTLAGVSETTPDGPGCAGRLAPGSTVSDFQLQRS